MLNSQAVLLLALPRSARSGITPLWCSPLARPLLKSIDVLAGRTDFPTHSESDQPSIHGQGPSSSPNPLKNGRERSDTGLGALNTFGTQRIRRPRRWEQGDQTMPDWGSGL